MAKLHGKSKQPHALGKERKESRQERRIRLEKEYEARQQCLKILPYVLAFIGLFFVFFAIWVRSIPPQSLPVQNQTAMPAMPPKEDFSTSSSEDFETIEAL